MAKFKNEKGLTLIELLITIAVLAVVSAIALPVINNVVSSSNSNAAAQTQSDVNDFITKYNAAGEVLVSADGRTLQGYVDTDGDNTIDANELIDTLTIDAKFSFSAAGTSDSVGGSYATRSITGATVGLSSGGGTTGATTFTSTRTAADFGGGNCFMFADSEQTTLLIMCASQAANELRALPSGTAIEISFTVNGQIVSANYTVDVAQESTMSPSYTTLKVQQTRIVHASGNATEFAQIRF
jgi:prepilin-type N-terminal cleavage/methylation domain-containing protein